MAKLKRKKAYFRPIHFFILLIADAVILSGVIIPQRAKIAAAETLLRDTQQQLNDIKVEYEREKANLEYMKSTDYKLQQGAVKYGWHYEDDTMIPDE